MPLPNDVVALIAQEPMEGVWNLPVVLNSIDFPSQTVVTQQGDSQLAHGAEFPSRLPFV